MKKWWKNGAIVASGLMLIASAARAGEAEVEMKAQQKVARDVAVPEGEQELRLWIKETRTLRTEPGRYFGRASLQILSNGTWIMTYIHSDHHWNCHDGQIEVMFSEDEGRTWLPPNTFTDGRPVEGLPSAPSPKESPFDPVEPYIYLAPNGDLLIGAMNFDLQTTITTKKETSKGKDWFTRSTDGGKTWSPWKQISQTGVPLPFKEHENDMTQQCFVKDGIMYASSRATHVTPRGNIVPALFKSTDNGETWNFVSFIGQDKRNPDGLYRSGDSEAGIELVGPTELVAVLRNGFWPAPTHMTRSHDMGKTWSEVKDISGTTKVWKRPRIYTLKHLRHMSGAEKIPEWWDHKTLIGTGPHEVKNGTRNVGLWYSQDKGETWSAPFHCDRDTQDAGYGDIRMRRNGELVVVSYHGVHDAADIKQYVIGINRIEKATPGAPVNRQYVDLVLKDGVVAYWRFEDDGDTAVDEKGKHDGAYGGVVAAGPSGARGVVFNGVPRSQRVEVPDGAELNRIFSGSFTIELWLQDSALPPDNDTNYSILYKTDKTAFMRNSMWFYRTRQNGAYSFLYMDKDVAGDPKAHGVGVSFPNPGGPDMPGDGRWHHYAVVLDREKHSLAGYRDGKQIAAVEIPDALTAIGNTGRLIIGNSHDASAPWLGGIDEVAIYAVALTAETISQHAALASPR